MSYNSKNSKEEVRHFEHHGDHNGEKPYATEHGEHIEARADNGVIDIDEGMDPVLVKKIMRKIDFRLIPILTLMYLVSHPISYQTLTTRSRPWTAPTSPSPVRPTRGR